MSSMRKLLMVAVALGVVAGAAAQNFPTIGSLQRLPVVSIASPSGSPTAGIQEAINALGTNATYSYSNSGGTIYLGAGLYNCTAPIVIPTGVPWNLKIIGAGYSATTLNYNGTAAQDFITCSTTNGRASLNMPLKLTLADMAITYASNFNNHIVHLSDGSCQSFRMDRCIMGPYACVAASNNLAAVNQQSNAAGVVCIWLGAVQNYDAMIRDCAFVGGACAVRATCDHLSIYNTYFCEQSVTNAYLNYNVFGFTNAWTNALYSSMSAVIDDSPYNWIYLDGCHFFTVDSCVLNFGSAANAGSLFLNNCELEGCNSRILGYEQGPAYVRWPTLTSGTATDFVATNNAFGHVFRSNLRALKVYTVTDDASGRRLLTATNTGVAFTADPYGNVTNSGTASLLGGKVLLSAGYIYATNMFVWGAGDSRVNGNYYLTNPVAGADVEWTNAANGVFFLIDPNNLFNGSNAAGFYLSSGTPMYGAVGFSGSADPFNPSSIYYDFTTNAFLGQTWGFSVSAPGAGSAQPIPTGAYVSIYATPGAASAVSQVPLSLSTNAMTGLGTASVAYDFSKPAITIMTNASFLVSGFQNVVAGTMNTGYLLVTNYNAAAITVTLGTGIHYERPYTGAVIGPVSSLVVTNAAWGLLTFHVWPGLTSNVWYTPCL